MGHCPLKFAHDYPDAVEKHHIRKVTDGAFRISVEIIILESANFDKALILNSVCLVENVADVDFATLDLGPLHAKLKQVHEAVLGDLKKQFTGGLLS